MTFLLGLSAQWQRIAIYGVVVLALLGAVWSHGFFKGREQLFEERAQRAIEKVKLIVQRGEVTEKIVTRYLRVREKVQPTERIITNHVITYVQSNTTSVLDARWGLLHDAAANRSIPPATIDPDAKATAPLAATALVTVTDNYAKHHACADQLEALQEWLIEQARLKTVQ